MVHQKMLAIAIWGLPQLMKNVLFEFKKLSSQNWKEDKNLYERIAAITSCLVCVSAECYSAWNIRRQLLQDKIKQTKEIEKCKIIKSELHLVNLALSKNPKSTESWSFRFVFCIISLEIFNNFI